MVTLGQLNSARLDTSSLASVPCHRKGGDALGRTQMQHQTGATEGPSGKRQSLRMRGQSLRMRGNRGRLAHGSSALLLRPAATHWKHQEVVHEFDTKDLPTMKRLLSHLPSSSVISVYDTK